MTEKLPKNGYKSTILFPETKYSSNRNRLLNMFLQDACQSEA
jgi:hypothetical protein